MTITENAMKKSYKENMYLCIIGTLALILGGLLYLIYRENTYISVTADKLIEISRIREILKPFGNNFLKFYLPDFLWAFSLACGLSVLLTPFEKNVILSTVTVFLSGLIYELLQYLKIIGGTFDLIDILMYLLAAFAVFLINLKLRRDLK